jgi:hypothetical protein
VGGYAPIDYEDKYGDFVNLKMMCRISLSEVLIGVRCACVCSYECLYVVYVNVFDCAVLKNYVITIYSGALFNCVTCTKATIAISR